MQSQPIDPASIHVFSVRDKYFVFDVHSCRFLETDKDMSELMSALAQGAQLDELARQTVKRLGEEKAESLLGELHQLLRAGLIGTPDQLRNYQQPPTDGVSTLCVNLAQACNLRCQYCFAEAGWKAGETPLMSEETAFRTVDFLMANSGGRQDLTVCFFGGEPLLNFEVMRRTVDYARRCAGRAGKKIRFNVTTNGTLLSAPVRKFLRDNNFGVIVSIDGGREVHNDMRPFATGEGSYDVIRANLDAFWSEQREEERPWTLRATFSRHHLNFCDQVFDLAELGFTDISVEPCNSVDPRVGIGMDQLRELKQEYSKLLDRYLEAHRSEKPFRFFHFRVMMEQVESGARRLTQCGAGRGYLTVSASGKLFPCHRMAGDEKWIIGNVIDGITDGERRDVFATACVSTKPLCRSCWARYICGGGCHACAIQFNHDIHAPYEFECELVKHRIELGAYLQATISSDSFDGAGGSAHGGEAGRSPYVGGEYLSVDS